MVVWKFYLTDYQRATPSGAQTVEMPSGATVLKADLQGESLVVWALVDPSSHRVARRFSWHWTGLELQEIGRYVGTVTLRSLVHHVFDDGERAGVG